MEDVVDHLKTTSSPEALAIHFLLRHAECRRALTGQTAEERLRESVAGSQSQASVTPPAGALTCSSEESLAGNCPVTAGVTKDDSCAARFMRAYAAARHLGAGPEVSDPVETATIGSVEDESWLKVVRQEGRRA